MNTARHWPRRRSRAQKGDYLDYPTRIVPQITREVERAWCQRDVRPRVQAPRGAYTARRRPRQGAEIMPARDRPPQNHPYCRGTWSWGVDPRFHRRAESVSTRRITSCCLVAPPTARCEVVGLPSLLPLRQQQSDWMSRPGSAGDSRWVSPTFDVDRHQGGPHAVAVRPSEVRVTVLPPARRPPTKGRRETCCRCCELCSPKH